MHKCRNISVAMSIMMLLSPRFFATAGESGVGGHGQLLHLCKNFTASLISISAGSIPNNEKKANLHKFLITTSSQREEGF